MHFRLPALLVTVGSSALLVGCGDAIGTRAQFNNREAIAIVYAINGTSPTLPAGLAVRTITPLRIDASFAFDLAFDLNASLDTVIVHSVAAIASELAPTHRVGMQITDAAFEQVTRSPTGGFVYDSTFRLAPGKTMLIDVIDLNCQFTSFLGFNIRAKMVVDSILPAARRIYLTMLTNPNCGFSQLTPGEPRD